LGEQYVIQLSKNHRIEMKGIKCIVIKVKEVVHPGRRTGTGWKRIYEMIVKDRRILQVIKKNKGGGDVHQDWRYYARTDKKSG